MGGMVSHPKRAPDDFGDAPARPSIPTEAEGARPLGQQGGNLGLLGGGKTRRATRAGTLFQRFRTLLPSLRQPLADGALTHPKRGGNLVLSPAHLEQIPGPS